MAGWLGSAIGGVRMLWSTVTFAGLYALGRAERVAAFEEALIDDLRSITNVTLTFPDDDLYVNLQPEVMTPYAEGGTRFFQVWDAQDGEEVDLSPSLQALAHRFELPLVAGAEPRRWDTVLPDGRALSVVAVRTSAHWGIDQALLDRTGLKLRDREVLLLVARARSELAESLMPLAWACALGAFVLPTLAGLLLWWLVPRALQPLRRLTTDIEHRDANDMRAFADSGVHELQPIVRHLNDLLRRIGGQRGQERRFLADTAHELRSPLAELHMLADAALLDGTDADAQRSALADAKALSRQLAQQVDTLFHLARYGQSPRPPEPFALAPLLRAALQPERSCAAAGATDVRWAIEVPQDVHVLADAQLMRHLLDNLAANTRAHAEPGSVATAAVDGDGLGAGHAAVLRLRNRCRKPSVESGQDHLGQGLVIAALYARAMDVRLETQAGSEWFEVCLVVPVATTARTAPASATAEPA